MLTKQTRQLYFGGCLFLLGSFTSQYLWHQYRTHKPAALLKQLRQRVARAVKVTGSWIDWRPQRYHGQTVYLGGLSFQSQQQQQTAYFALSPNGQVLKFSHHPLNSH